MKKEDPYASDTTLLINDLRSKKRAAQTWLYNKMFSKIRNWARQSLGEKHADDVSHDVLLKGFHSIENGKYEDRGYSLSTYFFRITRNLCIDKTRSDNYKMETRSSPIENAYRLSAENFNPEKIYFLKYRIQVLRECIDKLQPLQRKIVIDIYIHGYKYREVAERLNLKVGTVKGKYFQARKKLSKNPRIIALRAA